MTNERAMFLIAEYCSGPFYMGWHLYLRDNKRRQHPNANGDWGWQRDPANCRPVLDALGVKGELQTGLGDYGAIAQFAFAHSIPRQRLGGKPRGCVRVVVCEHGSIRLAGAAESESRVALP